MSRAFVLFSEFCQAVFRKKENLFLHAQQGPLDSSGAEAEALFSSISASGGGNTAARSCIQLPPPCWACKKRLSFFRETA